MTDQQLWQQLKTGEKAALEHIYRREINALLQYGLKFSQDTTLVEDCIQDMFVELWKKRNSIGATSAIRPYLLVALRRRIFRQLKQRTNKQAQQLSEETTFTAELAVDDLIIARELSEEQAQQLKTAFETLSARQREAVFLRYYQGLAYEDIADIMELNYQSVRNLVAAGIKRLRELMLDIWWLLPFLWPAN